MQMLLTAAAAKLLQSCPILCDSVDSSPPGPPRPWDFPGKSTGVGYHFLLQCMKVKSESEVTQSSPTLRNPMDCSLPVSSVHWIFQGRVVEWVAKALLALSKILNSTLLCLGIYLCYESWGFCRLRKQSSTPQSWRVFWKGFRFSLGSSVFQPHTEPEQRNCI